MQQHSSRSPHRTGAGNEAGPERSPIPEIIAEFSELFAAARSNWARFTEHVHPELSGGSMMVLHFIARKGPVTATRIRQVFNMDKAMLSRHIAKLRELGLVDAEPAPEDRRVQLLTASSEATGLIENVREQWAQSYHERFTGWSDDELEQLRLLLRRFNTSAETPAPDSPAHRCSRGAR